MNSYPIAKTQGKAQRWSQRYLKLAPTAHPPLPRRYRQRVSLGNIWEANSDIGSRGPG